MEIPKNPGQGTNKLPRIIVVITPPQDAQQVHGWGERSGMTGGAPKIHSQTKGASISNGHVGISPF